MTLLTKKTYIRPHNDLQQDLSSPEIFNLSFDDHVQEEIENIESELYNIAEAKRREKYLKKRLKALVACAKKLEHNKPKAVLDLISDEAKENRQNYTPMMLDISNPVDVLEKDLLILNSIKEEVVNNSQLRDFI